MNHQKLAKTLMRILGVWLLVQSIPQLLAATYTLTRMSGRGSDLSGFMWATPIVGAATLGLSLVLFYASDRLSRIIAAEP